MQKQQKITFGLMLGALGVVFGDIGTSPLYALKVLFSLSHNSGYVRDSHIVYGLISLLLWTVMLIVSIKYVSYVMRADNHGEGGIMALMARISASRLRHRVVLLGLGLVGVALFYGDSVVTPAISVLSAIEGLHVVAPSLSSMVVPLTLAVLVGLFWIQHYGTLAIGRFFGPVMLTWFAVIGLAGLWRVTQYPDILHAISPLEGLGFAAGHPLAAFLSMGAVVLAVTGAEALYADMGHFGRPPISRTWFAIVLPALVLCYLGQGALLIHVPGAIQNPFFLLFPDSLQLPVVLLATAATLIASQAVISGAFSLTRQAIGLGFLPRMLVRQTSETSIGQIFIPSVNLLLLVLVACLVIIFRSSEHLATAYGVAVSGTLLADSILFIATMRYLWHRSVPFVGLYAFVFLSLETILVAANLPKTDHGGALPLLLALVVLVLMWTWIVGRRAATRERRSIEPPLREFVDGLQHRKSLVRLPGQAVYIGHHEGLTPTALRTAVEELHELHQKAVIVYVETAAAAHVPPEKRVAFDEMGYVDGISQVTITYGFHDSPNIPKTLETARHLSPELDFDPHKAVYCISLSRIVPSERRGIPRWQKNLYTIMSRNALSASDYYHLPVNDTVEMRTLIKI